MNGSTAPARKKMTHTQRELSLSVLRAPQRASGASSGKRETASAPPRAAPRNARRRDAEARGPSRARVPAPTCVWVDPQTEPFEGRGKTKRTSDSIDDIESNPERPEILDESPSSAQALSTTHKPFTIERKHNSTSCALWSLPRIFSFFSFQEGSCRRLAAVYKERRPGHQPKPPSPACFSVPACLYFCSAVSPDACVSPQGLVVKGA